MEDRVQIPEISEAVGALAPLPESKRQEWRESYASAFKQALIDHPEDPMQQRATATREAYRIFRVGEVRNYAQAMQVPDWKLIHKSMRHGKLHIVTVEGTKFAFLEPQAAARLSGELASAAASVSAADDAAAAAAAAAGAGPATDSAVVTEAEQLYPGDPVAQARFNEAARRNTGKGKGKGDGSK